MEEMGIDRKRRRGRGAVSNAPGRFETAVRQAVHDGWDIYEELPAFETEVSIERPRSAITRNASPDVPFDRSINPYRGCEHGCIYCFARPTHAYLGLSPGLDFETRLVARPELPEVLRRELAGKRYRVRPIAMGTNTDPYQPIEARMRVMRDVVEVLAKHRHPLTIATKGTLIERDVDLLGRMAEQDLVHVGITVTTLDAALARDLEPRVPAPARRLAAIRRLSEAGIPVRVMVSPVVPGLTCHEIERILAAARDAGARAASWVMLRLPREVSPLFQEWLADKRPERARRVMNLVRETHGGRDYDPAWGQRMTGQGTYAKLIAQRFEKAVRRVGLTDTMPALRTDIFTVPAEDNGQLRLF